MTQIEHDYSEEIIAKIKADYRGNNLPDIEMFGRNNAESYLYFDNESIREVIKNESGLFKDITVSLDEISKVICKGDFMYLESKDYTFAVDLRKANPIVIDSLKKDIKDSKKNSNRFQVKNASDVNNEAAKSYFKEARKKTNRHGRIPLKQRFKIPLAFGVAGIVFSLIDMLDPLYGAAFSPNFGIGSFVSCLISGLEFFVFGFFFIFFSIWFRNLDENKKIWAIVCFPVTITAFAIIGVLGAIPYIIHLLILGDESYMLPKIIDVAAKITIVIVSILFVALIGLIVVIF
ncbi:hypothetical protein [Pseudobutyrivibrio ruminis]|uniref:Uncharacterized protein n=1 Tax=Pseudobutyrivibrio ruminis DSM 9787 TaxID=1123011 RepID=A0A285RD16_9FIRM|nr:hypothetical protein [Pseudobutyrivibrio ruminis]SOB91996.1 hypothetical protein SAMN02910411_0844 [Pseudobutyrivibrio ruminis DSM 9787]